MVMSGSGRPSKGLLKVVAYAAVFLFCMRYCRVVVSMRGRSQAITSHATWGMALKADRMAMSGPAPSTESGRVLYPAAMSFFCSGLQEMYTFSQWVASISAM